MNYKMMGRLIAQILLAEAAFMVPALIISLVGQDSQAILGFALSILVILAVAGMLMFFARKAKKGFYAREGMVCVGLAWIVMSLLGCLPFWISREIPSYLDGLFEIVSGFTTTGASILSNVEGLSNGMLYWRSFSHWVGGMGVLVFLLAVVPVSGRNDGFTMHLLRAESPGPNVAKACSKNQKHSRNFIYFVHCIDSNRFPAFDCWKNACIRGCVYSIWNSWNWWIWCKK